MNWERIFTAMPSQKNKPKLYNGKTQAEFILQKKKL